MPSEEPRNEFEQAVQADMMVNSMIRIAKDLEKALITLQVVGGLLAAILFVIILRWMLGH